MYMKFYRWKFTVELSVCRRNGRTEKYFDLDSIKNKKNKISTNEKNKLNYLSLFRFIFK